MHEAGDELVVRRVLVVLDSLEQGVGAVADADDGNADLVLGPRPPVGLPVRAGHIVLSCECCGECRHDELVRRASRTVGLVLERGLQRRRHAEEHRTAGARGGALAVALRLNLGIETATSFIVPCRRETSRASARLSAEGMRTRRLVLLAAIKLIAEYQLARSCCRTDSTR